MHKLFVLFLLILLLSITACGIRNTEPVVLDATSDFLEAYHAEPQQPYELPQPEQKPEPSPEEPTPHVEEPAPIIPREVTPVTLTLLVNGNFTTFDAKNIDGANYFRFSDLQYALEGIVFEEGELGQILCMAGESGSALFISEYNYNNNLYLHLRQLTDFLGFRVALVGSRNTIIIDTSNSIVEYPIFMAEPLPEHIIKQITGSSFHPEAPFDYCHLSYLTITHVDFDGINRIGHIIVAASIADEVLDIFREIYEGGFPIARVRLIDYYAADDYYSMADNNSVGFNFRVIAGTTRLSRHAWGMAIDINPVQNPFIRDDIIWPISGAAYVDRANVRPGMIIPGDVVYRAFTSRGWTWGGHWRVPIDYHHFERR